MQAGRQDSPEELKPPSAEPMAAPREPAPPKPKEEVAGGAAAGPCEKRELLWELGAREPAP